MLLSALVVSFAAAARPPSFVVLLGDDIGWADFSYNGGTAKTEKIDAWAASPGSTTPRGTRPLVKNDAPRRLRTTQVHHVPRRPQRRHGLFSHARVDFNRPQPLPRLRELRVRLLGSDGRLRPRRDRVRVRAHRDVYDRGRGARTRRLRELLRGQVAAARVGTRRPPPLNVCVVVAATRGAIRGRPAVGDRAQAPRFLLQHGGAAVGARAGTSAALGCS